MDGAGEGDFYAGIGDHRLVIEEGMGGVEMEKMKILPFFLFLGSSRGGARDGARGADNPFEVRRLCSVG